MSLVGMRKSESEVRTVMAGIRRTDITRVALVAVLALVLVFGAIGSADAAVALLSPGWPDNPQINNSTATSATFNYTPGGAAGMNRVVVVIIAHHTNNTTATTNDVEWGDGSTWNQTHFVGVSANNQRRQIWMFYVTESELGSNNQFRVTVSQGGSGWSAYAATYSGVEQNSPDFGTSPGTPCTQGAGYTVHDSLAEYPNQVTGYTWPSAAPGPMSVQDGGSLVYMIIKSVNEEVTDDISTSSGTIDTVGTAYNDVHWRDYATGSTDIGATMTWASAAYTGYGVMALNEVACTDNDIATLTTTYPTTGSTVIGTTSILATVGTETAPATMTGMVVNIAGAGACNVTNGTMTWNGGASRWEYTWDTSACGTGTPVTGVTVDVSGTDPDCGTLTNATQITNVTIDNTCSDANLATLTITQPVDGSTARGTRTVSVGIGNGQTASAMTNMQVMINGSWRNMSWGGTTWDYTWNTLADYPASATAPVLGVTIDAHGTDPTCTTVVDAPQISVKVDNTDPSKLSSCADCHGYDGVFGDGTVRNNPAGQFPGSHNTHVVEYGKSCSTCHVVPSTTDSASYKHRDGTVNMATALGKPGGGTAGTYARGSFAQVNNSTGLTTCSNTYCHSNGTSATTPAGSIPANTTSANWGGTMGCNGCHGTGDPEGRPDYADSTPKANKHQASTHAAQTCNICHNSVTWDGSVYTPDAALHANGVYNLQPSMGYSAGSNTMGGTCSTPGCHNSVNWGGSLACTDCHNAVVPAPVASTVSGGTVTNRPNIVSEFSLASNHKRASGGTVVTEDCIVCHMEGNMSTGGTTAVHKNGYIDLRDPDTGNQIQTATWGGAGAGNYTSSAPSSSAVRFSRNLDNNSLETFARSLMFNQCLKCHDSNGAMSTSAQVSGGSALRPFNTNAVGTGGNVLDVASQFAESNRAYHPVLHKQNNAYAGTSRMNPPWNGITKPGTATPTTTDTSVYGYLLTCWDCHAENGASGILTRTTTHGGSLTGTDVVPMRGQTYNTGTTASTNYCFICHAGYTSANNHAAGSAFSTVNRSSMGGINNLCINCHSSRNNSGQPARPIGAGDAHGYNTRATGGAFPNANNGYAFIRSEGFYGNGYRSDTRRVGTTNYTSQCTGYNGSGSICSRNGMGSYTPGGVY